MFIIKASIQYLKFRHNKCGKRVFGETKFKVGTGLKERVADEATRFLDFAPEFESTIQRTGVKKDKLFYFADCLRPWINAIDPTDDEKKRKRKFIFKRDPRDISNDLVL